MSHNKPVLLIGGPADGTRIILSAGTRIFNSCARGLPDNEDDHADATPGADDANYDVPGSEITTYAIGTVQGAFHEVFHVGTVDLNTCILCELVAGYRKPKRHPTDPNVAKQLVTLLGGAADGRQIVLGSLANFVPAGEMGDAYHVVPLICRDGTVVRVGVLDMMRVDPIRLLIEGYRMGAPA